METVTPGDYSFEFQITPSMLEYFRSHRSSFINHDDSNNLETTHKSEGMALKELIIEELESRLTYQVPSQGFENVGTIKIADLYFAYDNSTLIEGYSALNARRNA